MWIEKILSIQRVYCIFSRGPKLSVLGRDTKAKINYLIDISIIGMNKRGMTGHLRIIKRLISINKIANDPNHRAVTIGATERYIFRFRFENSPSLL